MHDDIETTMNLRELMCAALHVIEQSRQILEGVVTAKRADIVRNMSTIQRQVSSCQDLVDRLNIAVDQIEGDTVVEYKHKMHPLVDLLMARAEAAGSSIHVEILADEESVTGISYKIQGFYKSGDAVLVPKAGGRLLAKTRYQTEDDIDDFRELVALNYQWWQRSKDRADGWENPAEPWATWMVEFGMVKINTRVVKEYT